MRFCVLKSVYEEISKSLESRNIELFKKELVKILEKQAREEIAKSVIIIHDEWLGKSEFGVGTVRVWGGKKYRKIANSKWVRVYDKESGGINASVKNVIKKIERAKDFVELGQIVSQNIRRFYDKDNKVLPVAREILNIANEKRVSLKEETKNSENKITFGTSKKLFKMLEEYKKTLTDDEKAFVEEKMQNCVDFSNTVENEMTGAKYTGQFKVHPNRKLTNDELYMATLLGSLGFEVFMIEELSAGGKKVDAIVNGIPVDFKKAGIGNNAIKQAYQEGMDKEKCKGIFIHVDKELSYTVKGANGQVITTNLDNAVESWTKTKNNGILTIWIDSAEKFKTYDMKKIRAAHAAALLAGHPDYENPKPPKNNIPPSSDSVKQKNNINKSFREVVNFYLNRKGA